MENKMDLSNNLKILPSIFILILILYFKNRTIFIFLFYKLIKFFINVIIKSINKINYEQTLKGYIYYNIITRLIKCINFIKKFIYYYGIVNITLLSLYNKLIPSRVYRASGFHHDIGLKCFIISLFILIISILKDINYIKIQ